jgi:hypothetical protein
MNKVEKREKENVEFGRGESSLYRRILGGGGRVSLLVNGNVR